MSGTKENFKLKHWQVIAFYMMIYDVIAVNLSYFLSLWLRFDARFSQIPKEYLTAWGKFAPFYTAFCFVVFWRLRLYKSIWRFASYSELSRVAASSVITTVFHAAGITVLFHKMPVLYYVVGAIFQFLMVLGVRFSYRFILLERRKSKKSYVESRAKRLMVVGAGQAALVYRLAEENTDTAAGTSPVAAEAETETETVSE